MNLTTSPTTAIELVSIYSNDELELLGTAGLSLVSQPLEFAIKNNDINESHTFKNTFKVDDVFFYALEQVKDGTVTNYERGLGQLVFHNDKYLLKRKLPIATGTNASLSSVCHNGCAHFNCQNCEYLIAYTTVPLSYAECLVDKNSLITSVAPFHPHSFVIDNNSIVGRLDGDLCSISLDDKSFLDRLINALSSFTKQITLKTSKLDSKRISTPILQLNPTSNPAAKKGSVIYDENDNNLKYYDGSKWRTLVCKESE